MIDFFVVEPKITNLKRGLIIVSEQGIPCFIITVIAVSRDEWVDWGG